MSASLKHVTIAVILRLIFEPFQESPILGIHVDLSWSSPLGALHCIDSASIQVNVLSSEHHCFGDTQSRDSLQPRHVGSLPVFGMFAHITDDALCLLQRVRPLGVTVRVPPTAWLQEWWCIGMIPSLFDFAAAPGVNRTLIQDLSTCTFITRHENIHLSIRMLQQVGQGFSEKREPLKTQGIKI